MSVRRSLVATTLILCASAGSASAEVITTQPLSRTPTFPLYHDLLGASVAISDGGNVALAGGPAYGPPPLGQQYGSQGVAAVFQRSMSGSAWTAWGQHQQIRPDTYSCEADPAIPNPDQFGADVDISANGLTAIIGAPGGAVLVPDASPFCAALNSGYVSIWTRASTAAPFVMAANISLPSAQSNDLFGSSVAISGDGTRAVVGAPGDGTAGSITILTRDGGTWTTNATQQTIDAPTMDGTLSEFGNDVAMSSNGAFITVATRRYTTPTSPDPGGTPNGCDGVTFIYARDNDTFTARGDALLDTYSCAAFPADQNDFGTTAAIDGTGNNVAVSAPGYSSNDQFGAHGQVVFFQRPGESLAGVFGETTNAYADVAFADGRMGESLAMSYDGWTIAAGSPIRAGTGPRVNMGAVQIMRRSPTSGYWGATDLLQGIDEGPGGVNPDYPGQANDLFGRDVDVSADGTAVIVGAPQGGPDGTGDAEGSDYFGAVWFYDLSPAQTTAPENPPQEPPTQTPSAPTTPSTPDAAPMAPSTPVTTAPSTPATKTGKITWTIDRKKGRVAVAFTNAADARLSLTADRGKITRTGTCSAPRSGTVTCTLRLAPGRWRLTAARRGGAVTSTAQRRTLQVPRR